MALSILKKEAARKLIGEIAAGKANGTGIKPAYSPSETFQLTNTRGMSHFLKALPQFGEYALVSH